MSPCQPETDTLPQRSIFTFDNQSRTSPRYTEIVQIPVYQVDAFTDAVFKGNPAAICPLEEWLPEETMQSIAAENNLSDTAFFVRNGSSYYLRWFTPRRLRWICAGTRHSHPRLCSSICSVRNTTGSSSIRNLAR